jgi:sugar lactone lactonase YvrE
METRSLFSFFLGALLSQTSLARTDYQPYVFSTLAGNTGEGTQDGIGSEARFFRAEGIGLDGAGHVIVADTINNTIRMVTLAGRTTTIAGRGGLFGRRDGTARVARFDLPHDVVADSAGNLYITDYANDTIRKMTPDGMVSTFAGMAGVAGSQDGVGSEARFWNPIGITIDSAGCLFVVDYANNTIRKITPDAEVTTFAGLAGVSGSQDGTGSEARFWGPDDVTVGPDGNLFVSDGFNETIRQMTPDAVVTTLAGKVGVSGSDDGIGSDARFYSPRSVTTDASGNLYVADSSNSTIRKILPGAVVTTFVGKAGMFGSDDGVGDQARFFFPDGLVSDAIGTLFVADTYNNTVRQITPDAVVTTIAGLPGGSGSADGTGAEARFNIPKGVAVDRAGNSYVADSFNDTIRRISPAGEVVTIAGSPGKIGSDDGNGSAARFYNPIGIVVDRAGNIFVADTSNDTIRKITPEAEVTTFAGKAGQRGARDGVGSEARFDNPNQLAIDPADNIYVADTHNQIIRKITPDAVVTTVAGLANVSGSEDGIGSEARFNDPAGVAADAFGNLYVADSTNHTIRKIAPGAVVTTFAGTAGRYGTDDGVGAAARFKTPEGVAVDGAGNVYVADTFNYRMRRINRDAVVTTIAGGSAYAGVYDGKGRAVGFNEPSGVAADSAGNVYVADSRNHTIRFGHPAR